MVPGGTWRTSRCPATWRWLARCRWCRQQGSQDRLEATPPHRSQASLTDLAGMSRAAEPGSRGFLSWDVTSSLRRVVEQSRRHRRQRSLACALERPEPGQRAAVGATLSSERSEAWNETTVRLDGVSVRGSSGPQGADVDACVACRRVAGLTSVVRMGRIIELFGSHGQSQGNRRADEGTRCAPTPLTSLAPT